MCEETDWKAERRKRLAVTVILLASLLPLGAQAAEGTVDCDSLVLRKSRTKESKALQTLNRGDRFELLSASGDWYKVSYGKYTGYVMKKFVIASGAVEEREESASSKLSSDSGMKGIETIADIGDAPATSKKGDSGTKVKKLQQALKLEGYYDGKIDGDYGEGTEAAVKKFQKAHGMSRDGVAGKVTIKLLFGEAAADVKEKAYTTEKLSWFDGGSSAIPKGKTFTVKDVKTGKTFTCRRWSGVNHLDAEPLAKEDTETLKGIYGGDWSWRRRAILVKYGGHVYAASMNGMPHGTTTIDDNGFDGHFCIHFYKSKTHGTKKVDGAHQDAVETAAKYTW